MRCVLACLSVVFVTGCRIFHNIKFELEYHARINLLMCRTRPCLIRIAREDLAVVIQHARARSKSWCICPLVMYMLTRAPTRLSHQIWGDSCNGCARRICVSTHNPTAGFGWQVRTHRTQHHPRCLDPPRCLREGIRSSFLECTTCHLYLSSPAFAVCSYHSFLSPSS